MITEVNNHSNDRVESIGWGYFIGLGVAVLTAIGAYCLMIIWSSSSDATFNGIPSWKTNGDNVASLSMLSDEVLI